MIASAELHRVYSPAQGRERPETQQSAQVADAVLSVLIAALRDTAGFCVRNLTIPERTGEHWHDQAQGGHSTSGCRTRAVVNSKTATSWQILIG